MFADSFVERLRFSIDANWYGELPRSYFFDVNNKMRSHSGIVSKELLAGWFTTPLVFEWEVSYPQGARNEALKAGHPPRLFSCGGPLKVPHDHGLNRCLFFSLITVSRFSRQRWAMVLGSLPPTLIPGWINPIRQGDRAPAVAKTDQESF